MAGHYFYDPRPYYGLNMSTNLMPLDELFYKYEPVPYWMDQRMAPMSYPDYHPQGHVKQVMTRGPEVQQLLPYNRPELAPRDDIYADTYKISPHFSSFGPYPTLEMRQPFRGPHTQDDTYLHTMTPQYVNPQHQFPQQGIGPQRGYGVMAEMPVPMPMGCMGSNGGGQHHMRQGEPVPMHGAHMNNQNFPNQRSYNGGEQMDESNKPIKNSPGFNNNGSSINKSYTTDDGYGNKSSSNNKSYNTDNGYGNKSSSNKSYIADDGYGNKSSSNKSYNADDGYGNKSSRKTTTLYNNNDDEYSNKSSNKSGHKSKQEIYDDDYGSGNKTAKTYSNGGNHSTKSKGNTNHGQQRHTNGDSESDDDDNEYGSGKSGGMWGTKPLLKHGKGDTYSHGKGYEGSKKSGKSSNSSSEYQSYGGNTMSVFNSGKKQSGQKHGSQSSKQGYQNRWDSSSDEDESYAYTKKASKAGQHSQGITKVQHSHHGLSTKEQSRGFDSHVQSFGQHQLQHTPFHSQMNSVELKVPICCDNCERKVRACLEYVAGVESVLCDQWQKKVIVYGNAKPDVVLKRVRRVKKASEWWQQAPKRVPVY